MTINVDSSNRGDLETTLGSVFLKELHRYLGLDPDVPKQHQTVDVYLLAREAIGVIEKHQLSLILPGDVTLLLPFSLLQECRIDLPFGTPQEDPVVHLETTPGTLESLTFTHYQSTFPCYLWFDKDSLPDKPEIDVGNCVRVVYRTGYSTPEQVPQDVFSAIKVYCFHMLKRKEDGRSDSLPDAFWTFVNTGYQVSRQISRML